MIDTLAQNIYTKVDTLGYIEAGKVAAFYSDMIDKQVGQFNALILAISMILAVFLGVTIWWNIDGAKSLIKKEVEKRMKSLTKEINEMIEDGKNVINEQIDSQISSVKESLSKEDHFTKAELMRLYGSTCYQNNMFIEAAFWFAQAVQMYSEESENAIAVRTCVEAISTSCKKALDKEELSEEKKKRVSVLVDYLKDVPPVLSKEKNEIMSLVKELQKKPIKDKNINSGNK